MPVKSDYKDIDDIIRSLKIGKVDGIMADLGVSSYQLDTAERGFSYMKNGPLDMRMDPNEWLTAAEVVNRYSRDDLERIFRDYGEEHHAGRIKPVPLSGNLLPAGAHLGRGAEPIPLA